MKKICLVDFDMSVTGGVEQVAASLANAFCSCCEVYVFEINHGGACAYELDGRVKFIKGVQGKTRLREMISATFKSFIRFVKEKKIDVVLMMGNYPALIVSFTRFFTKARYVYCDHGALMNQWKQKDITAIRFWDALAAHRIVVLTEKTRKDYIRKFHVRPEKIRCIYNWVDPEVAGYRKAYCKDSMKILSVGRFGKEKGYDMLVEMARQVLPKYPDWQWDVYGTGETFDEIQEKIIEYRLEDQLHLKGNVKNAFRLYSEYAFLVLPSYREGLPIVLLEAAALGIPMISFDIETGPNEIIRDGENGYLVQPYDLGGMCGRIEELIRDPELRCSMSSEAALGTAKFAKEEIFSQWMALIDSLA